VTSHAVDDQPAPRGVILLVAVIAVAVNIFALSASQLWVCPDTSFYVALAGGIVERFDFSSDLFLIRPPGYPLMLAAIFAAFGSWSPAAILFVQHAMVVATAVVTALTAWCLTSHRVIALLAGLMCAFSLQLLAFTNVIITEVPYTLALVLCVYFLVQSHRCGGGASLGLASLMGGVSYLFRPIGMSVVAVCVLAAVLRFWKENGADDGRSPLACRRRWRSACAYAALAVVPALAVTAPGMVLNKAMHGGDLSTRCANLALYHRVLFMDRLDATKSESLNDIRAVVHDAVAQGALPADADYRLWGPVWKSYKAVRGASLAESSVIMGQAARDLIRENPLPTLERTLRYSFWMLMVPDAFYRFQPDGAPGIRAATGDCNRDPNAELFDIATYEPMLRRWIDPYQEYLPLRSDTRFATPMWSDLATWFHRHVEKGPSVLGLGDSPYEDFTWLCLIGVVGSLLTRRRTTWLLVTAVVVLQIGVSAFLAGPTPRYAVPVKPLLLLYAALPVLIPGWIAITVKTKVQSSKFERGRTRPRRTFLRTSTFEL